MYITHIQCMQTTIVFSVSMLLCHDMRYHGEPLPHKGLCKEKKFQKSAITGSGRVGPGLTQNFFFWKIALNQYLYFGVVYHVYSVCVYIAKSC